uniref:CUB domain-containing protein n=1 Tax=Oryzias latipes TaxID=8090 RepID=A0A3P9L388_ORYLA
IAFFVSLFCCSSHLHTEERECGGVLDASKAGYITSPGYPLEYPPHQNCRWIIKAPEQSQRIILNFNPHFEIERLDCKYDFIEIRDGTSDSADVLGRHCSNIAPAPIISSGPSVQVRFVSDYAHQGAGFSLRYEIFKTGEQLNSENYLCLLTTLYRLKETGIFFLVLFVGQIDNKKKKG